MSDYNFLKASDGTGNAVTANITANRAIGATVIETDNLDNWGDEFIVTTGTKLSTNFLDPDTVTEMTAHKDGTDIVIDGFEPGHTDTGNTIGQVAIIKQTTGWANSMVENAQVGHEDDGTHKADLPLTTPRIITSINDSNGNEIIKTPATASAVNEITVTNAATGNAVKLEATGGDTNISLNLISKGAGEIQLNGVAASGGWTTYVPGTVTGWSSVTEGVYAYKQVGKTVLVFMRVNGTSNATTVVISAPVTGSMTYATQVTQRTRDNGADGIGYAQLASTTTIQIYPNSAGGNWTASGSKVVHGAVFIYEAA